MAEQIFKHYSYPDNPSHIGIWALPNGKDIVVTIESIKYLENEKVNGTKKNGFFAFFKPNPYFKLPMVLNKDNRTRISALAAEIYIEKVKDLTVTLTKEICKQLSGEKDFGLRISRIKPKITPQGQVIKIALTPKSSNWLSIIQWVQEGNEIAKVTQKYDLSSSDLILFQQAIKVAPPTVIDVPTIPKETEGAATND